jgi:hypothetical protein
MDVFLKALDIVSISNIPIPKYPQPNYSDFRVSVNGERPPLASSCFSPMPISSDFLCRGSDTSVGAYSEGFRHRRLRRKDPPMAGNLALANILTPEEPVSAHVPPQ